MTAGGRALLIARLLIGLYLVELLLNLFRPRVLRHEPSLTIFTRLPGASGSLSRLLSLSPAVFWTVLAGIVVGVALQVLAVRWNPDGRRATVLLRVTLVALLGPFALIPLGVIATYPATALVSVPSTALVLLLLHNGQRFARLPLSMLLAAFGWGALIVFGLSRAYSGLALGTINGYLGKVSSTDASALLKAQYRVMNLLVLHLAVVTELTMAAGVLLMLVLFRRCVTDVVTGLVLGAAIGLGLNFSESVLFIRLYGSLSAFNGATGGFEYWIRQSIGLLGGQVAIGAVLGAALGLAAQVRQRRQRTLIAGAGLLAAIGGATAMEILSAWFSHLAESHIDVGGTLDTLVISPFLWLLVQSPFIALYVLLLRAGCRVRAAAARTSVPAEAAAGHAITDREVPFLVDPALRLWAVVSTWRRYGRGAALALNRVQAAQLDLAGWRWRRQCAGSPGVPVAEEKEGEELRAKVIRLKSRAGAGPVVTR